MIMGMHLIKNDITLVNVSTLFFQA